MLNYWCQLPDTFFIDGYCITLPITNQFPVFISLTPVSRGHGSDQQRDMLGRGMIRTINVLFVVPVVQASLLHKIVLWCSSCQPQPLIPVPWPSVATRVGCSKAEVNFPAEWFCRFSGSGRVGGVRETEGRTWLLTQGFATSLVANKDRNSGSPGIAKGQASISLGK